MENKHDAGHLVLRIVLGLLFIVPGISKLMDPSGIIGMLSGLGIPIAGFFGWILLLSEIVFGLSLVIGWKTEYTTWPLLVVLVGATFLVAIPSINMSNPMTIMGVLWHLVGIGGLTTILLSGPGKYKV
jgi:putative oxidoreductase